jgi:hypothetical protein
VKSKRPHDASIDPLLRVAAQQAGDTSRAAAGPCLEPDVIAAWAEGRIGRDAAAALETHAASCARCRAMLAAFAQTTPPAPASAPWWKAPALRWAAPLAAVAGTAVIWVTVDRSIEQDRATPADIFLSAREVAAGREGQPGPPASPDPREPGEKAVQPEAARARAGTPAQQAIDSVKPAPPTAAPAPPVAAPTPLGGVSEAPAREMAADSMIGFQAAAATPLMLTAPDKSTAWRVMPGRIERTTDGGATWDSHPVSTPAPLTTGACPSTDVCWIAGLAGTVLRTVDGRTWTQTALPDPADILSIDPTDASSAVVTMVDGRSFVTADGGRTWSRRPVQEPAAAPF